MSAPYWSKLNVSRIRGRSRLVSCKTIAPLKVFNPKHQSEFCPAILSNYGGGFVQGDTINIKICIDQNAKCYLGTQANTRIYGSTNKKCSSQVIHGKVETNGMVIVYPDPIVPHAKSRFKQTQNWDLEQNSSLFLVETLHPGRIGLGEEFRYHYYSSVLNIRINQKLIVKDCFVFEPHRNFPNWPGNFGPYRVLTNIFFIGELLKNTLKSLKDFFIGCTFGHSNNSEKEKIHSQSKKRGFLPAYLLSVTDLKLFGYVVRILAREPEQVSQILSTVWDHLTRFAIVDWNPGERKF